MPENGLRVAPLEALTAGLPVPFGGDRVTFVDAGLAARFRPGDRLVVVQESGELLHVSAEVGRIVESATAVAVSAFSALSHVPDAAITAFFEAFARRLEDGSVWAEVAAANASDIESARSRGRSTTRLAAGEGMRQDMITGLRAWRDSPANRGQVLERIDHDGWSIEQYRAPLGVVGFVFEGRPNVFADAAGVLRTGNAVVFRIGSDALGTARALREGAVRPALAEAGLPPGAMSLVDSAERSAGWALFADRRLALAVARGSGPAVAQLGAIARQTGTPVSLHGTGGAWMVADVSADPDRFREVVFHSLDRKVCNTLNVCVIVRPRAAELVPGFLAALEAAGRRRRGFRLHVLAGTEGFLPGGDWMASPVEVMRSEGLAMEPRADTLAEPDLAQEWEWEETPEVTLAVVDDLDAAIGLFNRWAPRLVATLVTEDPAAFARFEAGIEAPFTGDGFTRWVDGQYALNRPELGLSNWEGGRLFARGGVLAGDGVFTIRTRMRQVDTGLDRTGITSTSGSLRALPEA